MRALGVGLAVMLAASGSVAGAADPCVPVRGWNDRPCPDIVATYDHPGGHPRHVPPSGADWDPRSYDVVTDSIASHDGELLFVTGWSDDATTTVDGVTLAFRTDTGERVWERRFTGSDRHVDTTNSLALSPDGSTLFVAATAEVDSLEPSHTPAAVVLAYDAGNGQLRWAGEYVPGGEFDSTFVDVAVSADGTTVYAGGFEQLSVKDPQEIGRTQASAIVVGFDAVTGERRSLWQSATGAREVASDVVTAPDGTVYAIGTTMSDIDEPMDWLIVALEQDNPSQGAWSRTLATPGNDLPWEAAVVAGQLIVVGQESPTQQWQSWGRVESLDRVTGEQRWTTRLGGDPRDGYATQLRSLAVSETESLVAVSGLTTGEFDGDQYVATLDSATGTPVWEWRYDGTDAPQPVDTPGYLTEIAAGVAFDAGGESLLVAGWTALFSMNPIAAVGPLRVEPTPGELTVAAYSVRDGSRSWIARYAGPGTDKYFAREAVLAGGRIFAVGDVIHGVSDGYADPEAPTTHNHGDMTIVGYDLDS